MDNTGYDGGMGGREEGQNIPNNHNEEKDYNGLI